MSISNNQYLCYDATTFQIDASCTDPSASNTQFSFQVGDDRTVIVNDVGNYVHVDTNTNKLVVNDQTYDDSAHFSITQSNSLGSGTYYLRSYNLGGSVINSNGNAQLASSITNLLNVNPVTSTTFYYVIYDNRGNYLTTTNGVLTFVKPSTVASVQTNTAYQWFARGSAYNGFVLVNVAISQTNFAGSGTTFTSQTLPTGLQLGGNTYNANTAFKLVPSQAKRVVYEL